VDVVGHGAMSAGDVDGVYDQQAAVNDTGIPSRRMSATVHLKRAAQSELSSDAERYHLAAAVAEALVKVEQDLAKIGRHLELVAAVLETVGAEWLKSGPDQ